MSTTTRIGTRVFVTSRDGTRIACQVAGPPDGQPVILTSGIGCGPVFYKHLARELAADHRVIYWDYRAHGGSGEAADGHSYDIASHAEDLEAVVQALVRRPPVMIGFSMGVQVTVEWARRWPDWAAAYVFLLGMPANPLRSRRAWGNRLLPTVADFCLNAGARLAMPLVHPLSRAALRTRLSYVVAKRTGLISPQCSPEDFDEFIHYSSAIPPDAYLRCGIGVLAHDASDAWLRLRKPTLYVAAERDVLVRAVDCAKASHELPNGVFELIAAASHAGMIEAGRPLALRVRGFIEEQVERARPARAAAVRSVPARDSFAAARAPEPRPSASWPGLEAHRPAA